MTFLKKLGEILRVGTKIIVGFDPLIRNAIPGNREDRFLDALKEIRATVITAEAMGQTLNIVGPDKLKMVTPVIAQILLQADGFKGHKIVNEVLFLEGTSDIGSGVAKVLNSFKDDVDTEDAT
jgi:hypothetical protein